VHQAFVLAKNADYLALPRMAFPGMLEPIAKQVPEHVGPDGVSRPFVFVAAAGREAPHNLKELPEPGVVSMGRLTQQGFYEEVARSKMLVRPSPWRLAST